jgi:hypothetical protein
VKTWQSPEWKKNRDEFLRDKFCAWHGNPIRAEVPHHPQKEGSISDAEYLSLKDCIPLCKRCHFAARKGLKLCPVCKTHYYKPKRGRDPMCWNCFSKTPFGARVKQYYDNHPEFKKRRKKKVFLAVKGCSNTVLGSSCRYGKSPCFSRWSVHEPVNVDHSGIVFTLLDVGGFHD